MINLALRSAEPGSAKSIWGENFSKKGLVIPSPALPLHMKLYSPGVLRWIGIVPAAPNTEIPQGQREREKKPLWVSSALKLYHRHREM